MNILTITCHDCYNYGASLQAYALQTYLSKEGHVCQIIDYIDKRVPRKYEFFKPHNEDKYQKIKFIGKIVGIIQNRGQLKFRKRKKAFLKFKEQYLITTPQRYNCYNDLKALPPKADAYIVGSDQVWNTDMLNGTDPSFYLGFAPSNSLRISYAASFGIPSVREHAQTFVSQMLQTFHHISVREKTALKIVNDMGSSATQVLDPVFLLSKEKWYEFGKIETKDPYLLLYYLGPQYKLVENICKQIATRLNLKIYSISNGGVFDFADKNIIDAGPVEFIKYFRSASFVVSTSFHATAFSLIFNKQFVVCPIKGQENQSRMTDLLSLFNLESRFLKKVEDYDSKIIDYDKINIIIENEINKSKAFLKTALQLKK